MNFHTRLKELRLQTGEKQSDIAEIIGKSVQSYSSYEAGREPDYITLCKIAKHFDVSIDYLLGMSRIKTCMNDQALLDLLGLKDNEIARLEQQMDDIMEICKLR